MTSPPLLRQPQAPPPRQAPFDHEKGASQPLAAYAGLIGVFNASLAGFLLLAKRTGRRLPNRVESGDLVLLGLATHQLSRMLTKEKIATVVRAPFAEPEGPSEIPAEVEEAPQGTGLQRALGELLTCPYCLGTWIAAFFGYGLVLAPAPTRLVAGIFATVTLADFLHLAYRAANKLAG